MSAVYVSNSPGNTSRRRSGFLSRRGRTSRTSAASCTAERPVLNQRKGESSRNLPPVLVMIRPPPDSRATFRRATTTTAYLLARDAGEGGRVETAETARTREEGTAARRVMEFLLLENFRDPCLDFLFLRESFEDDKTDQVTLPRYSRRYSRISGRNSRRVSCHLGR